MSVVDDIPEYERQSTSMRDRRSILAPRFARQIQLTVAPWLSKSWEQCDVVDVGCGYGHTAAALSQEVRSVIGIEPSESLALAAQEHGKAHGVRVVHGGHEQLLHYREHFDLAVMDNVFEHIPNQAEALANVAAALRPGGVLYLLVPNRTWPIEAHYGLPFLSWLPLPLANRYLRLSGRGEDYTDASYAPSCRSLQRFFANQERLEAHFVLPGDVSLAQGSSPLYRAGVVALKHIPALWHVSKALLVVAKRV